MERHSISDRSGMASVDRAGAPAPSAARTSECLAPIRSRRVSPAPQLTMMSRDRNRQLLPKPYGRCSLRHVERSLQAQPERRDYPHRTFSYQTQNPAQERPGWPASRTSDGLGRASPARWNEYRVQADGESFRGHEPLLFGIRRTCEGIGNR
jgi:hypothetical protein